MSKNRKEEKKAGGDKRLESKLMIDLSHEVMSNAQLTPRRMALVAAAKTGSPAFTIWPKDTAPTVA